jgi:thiamine kinase-like enzyme
MIMEYKVLIPSAGLGSRLGDLSKNMNKSLMTVYTKPVLSYVIDKFPKDIEIVIAVGYMAQLIKDFVALAYPDRKITFVDVDIYEGTGSGLGYTLLKCEQYVQCPFVFYCNDTIVLEDIPLPDHNWVGYADVYDNTLYRSMKIENGQMVTLNEKNYPIPCPALMGINGTYDYAEFWKIMREGIPEGSITKGETFAFRKMIHLGIEAKKFTWFDTGNVEALQKTIDFFDTKEYNILKKPNESIWFIEDKVIKYCGDKDFISERVKRNKSLNGLIPRITGYSDYMYSYKFVPGTILSRCIDVNIFNDLLEELKTFWKIKTLSEDLAIEFRQKCLGFYQYKTYKRVDNYFVRYNYEDSEEIINGVKCPKLMDLLERIDWDHISNGIPSVYHGDLHFENILLSDTGNFVLLDWRQNFADIIEYGDLYYDLAKLLHGIIVSDDMINNNHYIVKDDDNNIKINIFRNQTHVEIEHMFFKFLKEEHYDIQKVKILTALIYLNIATLHHYPYSKFLFYFGKYMLNNILNEKY